MGGRVGGAVQLMLVAIVRAAGGVAAAAGTQCCIRTVGVQGTLYGHRSALILTCTPHSTRVGRQLSGVDAFWVCLQRLESDIKGGQKGWWNDSSTHAPKLDVPEVRQCRLTHLII